MNARFAAVVLGALVVASAMGLVTAQHRARTAFVDLEQAQHSSRELAAEGDRLRIELGRVARPAAIEAAARDMGLRPPDPARTVLVPAQSLATESKK
jgi:cell division protein FtsL